MHGLRLNLAHTLCQPNRNLVFATFGTGYGAQVLDLSDRPSHGTIKSSVGQPAMFKTLVSNQLSNVPTGMQYFAGRGQLLTSNLDRIDYGLPSKLAITGDLTVAVWWRPHVRFNSQGIPFTYGDASNGGWAVHAPTSESRLGSSGTAWSFSWFNGSTEKQTIGQDQSANLKLGDWCLLVATKVGGSTQPTLYFNGAADAAQATDSAGSTTAATSGQLQQGIWYNASADLTYSCEGDFGPAFVWGSVLSAADVALLYRDTWGLVSRNKITVLGSGYAGAAALTTGPTTVAGSATHTLPVYSIVGDLTAGPSTVAATATHALPTYTASAVITVAPTVVEASGGYVQPSYVGTGTLIVGPATITGQASYYTYGVSANLTTGPVTVEGTGTFTATVQPQYHSLKDAGVIYRDTVPSSTTDLYTSPSGNKTIITGINFVNPDHTQKTTISLWIGTASNVNLIAKVTNLTPIRGEHQVRDIIMNPGDVLRGSSTNGICTCVIEGYIIEAST